MKKALIIAGVLLVLLLGVFVWLLRGAAPQHSPQEIQVIDIQETNPTLSQGRN